MGQDVFRGTTLVLLISSLCLNGTGASAQQPKTSKYQSAFARPLTIDRGSAALSQSLQKLHTRASLAMVVAHPDDEAGGMLTYQSPRQGVDTTLLTPNRREGGQKVMTPDYWGQGGSMRPQEVLT